MVVHLNDLAGAVSILNYMSAPHRIARAIAEAVARPAVYNRDVEGTIYIHVPDNWRPDLDRENRHSEAEMLVLLMSVAARLIKSP
jgi:hypothetical protein